MLESKTDSKKEKKGKEMLKEEIKAKNNSNTLTEENIFSKDEVYKWAVRLTNEDECSKIKYLVPDGWFNLGMRLTRTTGNLIKVIGAQGIGKTAFSHWLHYALNEVGSKAILKQLEKGKEKETFKQCDINRTREEVDIEEIDGFGKTEWKTKIVETTKKEWDWNVPSKTRTIIVDLWDYSKNREADIVKALDTIRELWLSQCREHNLKSEDAPKFVPNIVLFLQKEALPLHFFLGKFSLRYLKPYKPEELAKYLEFAFGSSEPFTEEALYELAVLSQGVFRRFKEYIGVCIEPFLDDLDKTLITLEDVKKIVTVEKLMEDRELELSEIFPRSKTNREYSVKVLRFLRERGPVFQETIEQTFFPDNPMGCSRLLNTLELHDYIKHSKDGRKRRWRIK